MIFINDILRDPELVELITRVFSPDGHLCTHLKLEHRPEQLQMAEAVAESFATDKALLFEAGTGVGKTLAYLIPGIIHAHRTGRPFWVSTHTLALQHQIMNKDLPLCHKIFANTPELAEFENFKVAMLMGRGNYLCPNRLAQAITQQGDLFASEHLHELDRIARWASTTQTGLVDELSPAPLMDVWHWVNAESSSCQRKHCTPNTCFYTRARAAVRESQVVILNHSLVFSLMGYTSIPEETRGVLFSDDFAVLDEAHTVPEIASEHFGLHISNYSIDRALKSLYHPKRQKGLLARLRPVGNPLPIIKALEATETFFSEVGTKFLAQRDVHRLHQPSWGDPVLLSTLMQACDHIKKLMDGMDPEDPLCAELNDQHSLLLDIHQKLLSGLEISEKDHVYWIERSGKAGQVITLKSAPIDVAPYLERALFRRDTGVILTSATLSTGQTMLPLQKTMGATTVRAEIVESPFSYENQSEILIATDAPVPSAQTARGWTEYLATMVMECTRLVEGGSLVLFTSYTDMRTVADRVRMEIEATGRPLLVQGEGQSRPELTRMFAQHGRAVLLGTASFWTGIDVPGSALSQVIVTRLPFANPSHPLTEARFEHIQARGGSPFNELTLPEAIIQFRQGVGRLIRQKTDTGLITILDSRILTKPYGRQFLAALPLQNFKKISKQILCQRGQIQR